MTMDRSCNAGYNLEHNTFGWIGKTGVRFFVLMLSAMAIVIAAGIVSGKQTIISQLFKKPFLNILGIGFVLCQMKY